MSIILNKNSKVLVCGITGSQGSFHTQQCIDYGTNIVAGVTPNKGGTSHLGVPVFNTVSDAVKKTSPDTAMIFVPPPFAADSIIECAYNDIKVIICITEGIPVMDMTRVKKQLTYLKGKGKDIILVGPNCPGVITPDESKCGIMPGYIHKKGSVGIVSRSGTLTYEAVWQITQEGLGESTVVGMGGDPVHGINFIDTIKLFNADKETKAILMIGEIGGSDEEEAADYIKKNVKKPVFSFIAGKTAPKGRRMGHAGAIVEGSSGTHESKVKALSDAGITVIENLSEIGKIVSSKLKTDSLKR
ncbi:MAG: succinate--CoA ligase subunit alpha [Elusimicrobia bacterium]|jgi:succinyl-CoA synthetase alpha subunit|nr:succinate--CoA ligase subunit alpha [Elusimicrobiota bacterium]